MKVGVVGASGYSGEELLGILLEHPGVEVVFAASRQHAGRALASHHVRFRHFHQARDLILASPEDPSLAQSADLVFLALPHGVSAQFAHRFLGNGKRVIDLSADFRLKNKETYQDYYGLAHPCPQILDQAVYGLPELNRKDIALAALIAAPGCYPTSIILPCLPLLRHGLVHSTGIIANSYSSPSGAGRKPDAAFLFNECHESLRPYGVGSHRHVPEIEQELSAIAGRSLRLQFVPHLAPVNRGILSTLYLAPMDDPPTGETTRRIRHAFEAEYTAEPFVSLLPEPLLPDTARVARTNLVEIAWRLDSHTGRLIVMSAIDNLGKGAASQAVQCMNIMAGLPEAQGLGPSFRLSS